MPRVFRLHDKLAADTLSLGQTDLCEIRLVNDRTWPWVLLVPRRPDVQEIYQLSIADQQRLLSESSLLGEGMMECFSGDKLNVAALGNSVPQLHLHHVVRHRGDPAWPGPVWGVQAPVPYSSEQLNRCRTVLEPVLAQLAGTA